MGAAGEVDATHEMLKTASDQYLRQAVMTSSPEQLQLMLYDGAIRFAQQGRDALERKDFSASCEKLLRAQRIVVEMESGLRHDVNPELCGQLASLYRFVYHRLIDANMNQDLAALDEAIRILRHQRETWQVLVDRIISEPQEAVTDAPMMNASA